MDITEVKGRTPAEQAAPRMTAEQMQNEYNFILAQSITEKMRDKGLISEEEFNKITEKNRDTFSPFMARLIS